MLLDNHHSPSAGKRALKGYFYYLYNIHGIRRPEITANSYYNLTLDIIRGERQDILHSARSEDLEKLCHAFCTAIIILDDRIRDKQKHPSPETKNFILSRSPHSEIINNFIEGYKVVRGLLEIRSFTFDDPVFSRLPEKPKISGERMAEIIQWEQKRLRAFYR